MLEPSGPCPKGQFTCDQGKRCLHLQMLCNFKAECDDASDEQQCGKAPEEPFHFPLGWGFEKSTWLVVQGFFEMARPEGGTAFPHPEELRCVELRGLSVNVCPLRCRS